MTAPAKSLNAYWIENLSDRVRNMIAEGTSSPGFARLTTPVIGAAMVFFGLFEGLFGSDHVFLGIATGSIVLIILAGWRGLRVFYPERLIGGGCLGGFWWSFCFLF